MNVLSMSARERAEMLAKEKAAYASLCAQGLSLDLSRGKPAADQLDLSMDLLNAPLSTADMMVDGVDCRNYGAPFGLPSMRRFWGELVGVDPEQIIIGGPSSLNLMYDTVVRCLLYGTASSPRPWSREGEIIFLCPSPGYDRHFGICESLGIRMIPVEMTENGPDMAQVEQLVQNPAVKGIWCVPKYSNPTGITYSEETVRRLARMPCAAPDFRIFWDNAYMIHDLYAQGDTLADIFALCREAGTEGRVFYFTSSSKITFPGAGVAMMAASESNLALIRPQMCAQVICHDKINQLRHLRFLRDKAGVQAQMRRQADLIRGKFRILLDTLQARLGGLGIARWTDPHGGYFVSLDVPDGCAQRVYDLCREAGVTLTKAGSTYPYGKDPHDRNLRLAPTYPTEEQLRAAAEVLCCAVRLAALEKLEQTGTR